MSPRTEPTTTIGDFFGAIDLAYNAGARGAFNSNTWSALEASQGVYKLTDLFNGLEYLGNKRGFVLLEGIQMLNTTAKETPSDLMGVPFDSPKMKARFHALIDRIRPHLNSHVKYISIGNEVDVYLGTHPSEQSSYENFYADAAKYVKAAAPWVKVGVTFTYDGARGDQHALMQKLNRWSDIVLLTYYPLGDNFVVREPDAPLADLPRMVTLAQGRPLILQEVGYPAAARLDSSDEKQATFVRNVYAAWSRVGGAIPFLNFFLEHDIPQQQCDSFSRYYGLPGNQNFGAFLCSLGLRRVDGRPKAGWQAFVDGAAGVRHKSS